jgi:hypothetical protein
MDLSGLMPTLTKKERYQAIQFQDAIGTIIDEYLLAGMPAKRIAEILRDEADSDLVFRRTELEEE